MPVQSSSDRVRHSHATRPAPAAVHFGQMTAPELMPLAALKPYAGNARKHSPKQVGQIAQSIKEFGFIVPILVDAAFIIVAGHGRLEAARLMGLTKVPVVRVEHLSPAQVRAYRIADNRIAEKATWDDDLLRVELQELIDLESLGEISFDIDVTGFETPEIDILLADAAAVSPAPDPANLCDAPDLARPLSRLGDLWQCGPHRIVCGSALITDSYAQLMGDERVAMIITDPPYNVRVNGHVRAASQGQREFLMASGEQSSAEFTQFLATSFGEMKAACLPGALIYSFMDWRHLPELHAATQTAGLAQLNLIVWAKTNGGMGSFYRSQHELLGLYQVPGASHTNNIQLGRFGRNRTNVWSYAGVNSFGRSRAADLADHPTVKPVAMIEDAIRDATHRGALVLDPFSGSGTTLMAAARSGRIARLIELDPSYVDVAIRRWQTLTGEIACEHTTGHTLHDRQTALSMES